MSKSGLKHIEELYNFNRTFLEKGLGDTVENLRQNFEGKVLNTQRDFFKMMEMYSNMDSNDPMKAIIKQELIVFGEEIKVKSTGQWAEKLEKEKRDVIETIATVDVFVDLISSGIKDGLKPKEVLVKNHLPVNYPGVEDMKKNIINRQNEIRKKLRESY